MKRSLAEVNELADIAGVIQRKGSIQSLYYSTTWMKEDYKLIELSNELIKELKEGDNLVIRGDVEDECVICTRNQTFELRAAETTNSLLVLPRLITPKSKDFSKELPLVETPVLSCFNSYYEVRPTRPKLQRLRKYLTVNAYSGYRGDDKKEKFTTEDLLDTIQCSEAELTQGLIACQALQVDGYWRTLEINYQEKAFSQILALVEEKGWSWKEIPTEETCEILKELYPSFVLLHCFMVYGSEIKNGFCFLSEDKVCRYYVEYILRSAPGKFNYNEFLSAWSQSVPDGMNVKSDHLLGIALTDLKYQPPLVWHFPEHNLPDDPAQRFNFLFKTREKWTYKEIEPYLKNIVGSNENLNTLLLKFTRSSTADNGEKVYNSKRPLL
ncbi:sister chromatid cohesion protein DCC1 isoform X3 [Hydra vulgaris]|uniref:Sister chromatid cohesion protein DCC1 n=1 Tax=Hydra vulgaris TaxID=6087 RepID=A0ABM4BCB4_HYDVU